MGILQTSMTQVHKYNIQFGDSRHAQSEHVEEGRLAVDVVPSGKNIFVIAPMSGVDGASIDVHVHNDVLTIRGKRTAPAVLKATDQYYHQECFWGPFSRTVVLPVPVIAEQAEATFSNGVLQIQIPKRNNDKHIPITIVED